MNTHRRDMHQATILGTIAGLSLATAAILAVWLFLFLIPTTLGATQ